MIQFIQTLFNKLLNLILKLLQFLRLCDDYNRLSLTNILALNGLIWFNFVMWKAIFGTGVEELTNVIGALAALVGGSINYGVKKFMENSNAVQN